MINWRASCIGNRCSLHAAPAVYSKAQAVESRDQPAGRPSELRSNQIADCPCAVRASLLVVLAAIDSLRLGGDPCKDKEHTEISMGRRAPRIITRHRGITRLDYSMDSANRAHSKTWCYATGRHLDLHAWLARPKPHYRSRA